MNGPPSPNEESGGTPPPLVDPPQEGSSSSNNSQQQQPSDSQQRQQQQPPNTSRNRINLIMHEMHRRNGIVHVDFLEVDNDPLQSRNDNLNTFHSTASTATQPAFSDTRNHRFGEASSNSSSSNSSVVSGSAGPLDPLQSPQQPEQPPPQPQPVDEDVSPSPPRRRSRGGSSSGFSGLFGSSGSTEIDDFGHYHRFRPLRHTGTVYFISIHEDDQNSKASERAIQSLRRVPLSEIPVGDRDCTICYEPLTDVPPETDQTSTVNGDDHYALAMPNCNHMFGASCLRSWLQSAASCPLCRSRIESEAETRGSRFPRFGTSMPFFFERMQSRDASRDSSQTPPENSTEGIRIISRRDSAQDAFDAGNSTSPTSATNTNTSANPNDHSEFEREVAEMLNNFRNAQQAVGDNQEERNTAFMPIIEAVLRQVASRINNEETTANQVFGRRHIPTPVNTDSGSSSVPGEQPQPSQEEQQTPQEPPSQPPQPPDEGTFSLRQFIRLPQNPVQTLAELRSRQSEVMRRAFAQSWFGRGSGESDTPQQPPQEPQQLPQPQQPPQHDQSQTPPPQGITFHIHHPIFLPPSSPAPAQTAPRTATSPPQSQQPAAPAAVAPSAAQHLARSPSEDVSANEGSEMHVETDSAASTDAEERRSGPSRRSGLRHHPYQRNP